ncbi:hypothetical protein QJS10_CPB22g01485 [Acorus calamus]|uniref:Protein N-terminal asparagine amidohydrolase n=1 Tax=Acorus calamus TaxID=4465 RepID=A0AAV9C0G1_ACOCL|nr:hypothetical protein QJS10_CPB22g01485 [Acorus calamus]
MIFVDGRRFSQGDGDLEALLEEPSLMSASESFKAKPERKITAVDSARTKCVYIFQREYATVNPRWVEMAGMDEATTCVGLVIRNRSDGMTSIAHLDSPKVVDSGLSQMLALVSDYSRDTELDVHMIGGFDDAAYKVYDDDESTERSNGYSLPLCSKIIKSLQISQRKFHMQTVCILGHNTRKDAAGHSCPIVRGFLVETLTGSIQPASFDRSSRCPDEIVRRLRVTVSSGDYRWHGKLLETYDTWNFRFQIAACSWHADWKHHAYSLLQLSDLDILSRCSTSPSAESPDFVENERRVFQYLIDHPDWTEIFPERKPREFMMTDDGEWIICGQCPKCYTRLRSC